MDNFFAGVGTATVILLVLSGIISPMICCDLSNSTDALLCHLEVKHECRIPEVLYWDQQAIKQYGCLGGGKVEYIKEGCTARVYCGDGKHDSEVTVRPGETYVFYGGCNETAITVGK